LGSGFDIPNIAQNNCVLDLMFLTLQKTIGCWIEWPKGNYGNRVFLESREKFCQELQHWRML
jgi:hypothetical protein